MKPVRTWILIADGARARILLNEGPGQGVRQVQGCEFDAPNLRDREINADRPGRSFDSAGAGRHAMESSSSPQREGKRAFARQLVERLAREHAGDAFDRLIIAAPPQMLGDLRSSLTGDLLACLSGEIAKDLTRIPQQKIASHLEHLLAV